MASRSQPRACNPASPAFGQLYGYAAGHGLWEALGEESFVIGTTAYAGTLGWVTAPDGMHPFRQDIAVDQHPGFEFEELMDAAGFDFAWVNLRAESRRRSWLGGTFLARPLDATTDLARWSDVFDALLFIRSQQPNSRVGER